MDMDTNSWHEDLDFSALDLEQLAQIEQQQQTQQVANFDGNLQQKEQLTDFDRKVGQNWIYPSNLPCRAYQENITRAALFKNTLVVLPTGLGKTFIAACVIYNIYRWFPHGKVIFLAPTRPLVAQQINACRSIMPLPNKDTVELTGKLPRHKRFELWRTKRVFFATPQSVQSDIVGSGHDAINDFPFESIKLLVIDEAHRAKGRYAYTEVAQAIWRRNRHFRMLALSATPGRTVEDVAEVIRNLFISHLEVRWENSLDVMPYVQQRNIKTIVVQLGEHIKRVRKELIAIIDPYERQLIEAGVIRGTCANTSRNALLFEQKRFKERSLQQSFENLSSINSNFSICVSLYHALELLERHGLRVFLNFFEKDEDGRTKFVYNLDMKLRSLINELRAELGANPFDTSITSMTNGQLAPMPADLDFGHPKFEHARQALLQHFEQHTDSRAIVFCEYRESVVLIYRLLLQHVPVLRPRCFAGHSGTGPLRALTQKQQIQIMQDFREGKSNILVATSIAEEGLDVGEVNLIICFDINTTNPTRFIQRIGRTGRKKKGNVLMLVTEGHEQRLLKDVMSKTGQTNKKIINSSIIRSAYYKEAPRLVPADLNPVCVKELVETLEQRDKQEQENEPAKKVAKTNKNSVKSSQDLRNFFKNTEKLPPQAKKTNKKANNSKITYLDDEDDVDDDLAMPGIATQNSMRESVEQRFANVDFSDIRPASNSQLLKPVEQQQKEVNTKHLKKVQKLLSSTVPLVPPSQRKCDIFLHLRSKTLSRTSKLIILEHNVQFVADLHEKMQILLALEGTTDNNARVPKEERDLRETYSLVLQVLNGEQSVEEFVTQQRQKANVEPVEVEEEFLYTTKDFELSLQNILKAVGATPKYTEDNYDFIMEEYYKTEAYQRLKELETNGTIDEGSMKEEISQMELEDSTCQTSNTIRSLAEDLEILSKSISKLEASSSSAINCSIDEEFTKRAFLQTNKSTPVTKTRVPCIDLDDDTADELETALVKDMDETPDVLPELNMSASAKSCGTTVADELNIDWHAFDEPFPEEEAASKSNDSQKENLHKLDLLCKSPDLFEISVQQASPLKPQIDLNTKKKNTLAFKLAQKCFNKSPTAAATIKAKTKSPSVFESYRQKLQMHKAKRCNSVLKPSTATRRLESPVTTKKIVESISDSDFEEISPTQQPLKTSWSRRRKRPRLCEFLDEEAEASGSEQSAHEAEETIGQYMLDSVVVHDEDVEHESAASRSHMQAIYLQSVKSPEKRAGAFKIPHYEAFNDHTHIFSQELEDVAPSQYIPDSFVVDEDETVAEVTMCPLERAEMILKQKRRAKKLRDMSARKKRKRKVYTISDSSEE